ncbi:MAG TPA: Hsp20/alpha crystallin family protein [Gaiellaceae bacterium]|nr:Hsp20/alpha crystallin family protein [Gaiellaceae bacterium]
MASTLVRWSPFQELESFDRRMRRLFGEPMTAQTPLLPAADVYETPTDYVVELEVPGFVEKELTVDVSDHTLAVKGMREAEKETKEKSFLLHERLEKQFERRFSLPEEADTEHAKASFEHGVLKIATPKKAEAAPRVVPISKL